MTRSSNVPRSTRSLSDSWSAVSKISPTSVSETVPPSPRTSIGVANFEAGLAEHARRCDGLAGTVEPAPSDDRVPGPGRHRRRSRRTGPNRRPAADTSSCPIATTCAVSGSAAISSRDLRRAIWVEVPPASSARTGAASARSSWPMIRTSDRFVPIANVTAATPTTRAPSVMAARTGWAMPAIEPEADRQRRRQAEAHAAQPRRRAGRTDGIVPRVIAPTALSRPARTAGPIAANVIARTMAAAGTRNSTSGESVNDPGRPNDSRRRGDGRLAGDRPDGDAERWSRRSPGRGSGRGASR